MAHLYEDNLVDLPLTPFTLMVSTRDRSRGVERPRDFTEIHQLTLITSSAFLSTGLPLIISRWHP